MGDALTFDEPFAAVIFCTSDPVKVDKNAIEMTTTAATRNEKLVSRDAPKWTKQAQKDSSRPRQQIKSLSTDKRSRVRSLPTSSYLFLRRKNFLNADLLNEVPAT